MSEYILALDPSGAFDEGAGTTGYCLMNNQQQIIYTGDIRALSYQDAMTYWKAHLTLIDQIKEQYPDLTIVVEDYLLYAHKANEQINSRMETVQLIGILKYYCYDKSIPMYTQMAVEVKKRWADNILQHKQIIQRKGRGWQTVVGMQSIDRHALDAIRHAMHYATFYNK